MKRLINFILLLALLIFITVNKSNAQKKFEGFWNQTTVTNSTLPGAPKKESKKQQVYYKTGKVKTVDLDTGNIIILRLDKELMWNINKAEGTYTEIKFSDLQGGMKEASAAMKKMQAEMKDMPPEQRKMMEKMMGGKMKSIIGTEEGMKISIKKTDERKTISGFKCHKVIYYINNEPFVDFWITDKYQLGSEFMKLYQKIGLLKGDISKEADKIKGFPIQIKTKMDTGMGKVKNISTVTKIFPKAISNKEFELPNGLKKITMPAFPRK